MSTGTPPAGYAYYRRHIITTADAALAAGDYAFADQLIETLNLAPWKFGTATAQPLMLSFWVRSSVAGTFGGALCNSGESRNFGFTYTISAVNTWEYKTVAITGGTTGTWATNNTTAVRLIWDLGLGSTFQGVAGWQSTANILTVAGCTKLSATLNASLDFAGVQLELGTVATGFEHRTVTDDHLRCLRYYENFNGTQTTWCGDVTNAFGYYGDVKYKVPKRIPPTVALSYVGNNGFVGTVPSIDINATEMFRYVKTANATANGAYMVFTIIASAEF
ncbi:MAG: hypothetical protein H0V63_10350 [Burkholderiaceae bacterium]|nr:hypothetical protein [Burkholderiaceae bacterium]